MKGKKKGRILTVSLAASLLLSTGIPYNVKAESLIIPNTVEDVEKVLLSLSKEQRDALNRIDAKPHFTISPDIDTTSKELVEIIVEFKQSPAKIEVMKQAVNGKSITLIAAKSKVEEEHRVFKRHIESLQTEENTNTYDLVNVKITREYKHAINGVSMTLPGVTIKDLVESGVVKRIYKDSEIKLDLPKQTNNELNGKMADSIPQIGVDKLHKENIRGKGIKVGVLDTGIDYNHPDLAESYKGYRAKSGENPAEVNPTDVLGWDFVNNDADPMETTYEEWLNTQEPEFAPNGSAYYTSHGTHVSGTIAAQKNNNVDYAVKGVAPQVDLYSYKVLGPYGTGSTQGIIGAIDKSISDEMDVINLSLGSSESDPLSPMSIAVNNAMLSGVVTVVAAGNAGPNEKTVSSPGTAALGISVGASDVSMKIPTYTGMALKENFVNVQLLGKGFSDEIKKLGGKSFSMVHVGLGKKEDFTGKNVKGKIALIQRGEITFDEKIRNAKDAGAKVVFVYNNVDGEITSYLGEDANYIPSFRLTKEDGERLKKLGQVPFVFMKMSNMETEGDRLADFSSRGPVVTNYDIKPDVVAPGVSIMSTIPEFINDPESGLNYNNAYARMQGTSMAAPHVAGVAALILQENPDYTPFDVKAAFMNTSDDLNGDYSVNEVGAGRIDAYQAVHADTSIKVIDKTNTIENGQIVEMDEVTGSIVFGKIYKEDAKPNLDSKKVSIHNTSKNQKKYKVNVEYHRARNGIQDATENGVKITVPESVILESGKTEEIQVGLEIPTHAKIGNYEGYIHVENAKDATESYQIPFAVVVSEKGFNYVTTNRPSLTNDTPFWDYYEPFIHGKMKLNSPMKTIDVIVKDGATGEALGYLGTIDGSRFEPDMDYFLLQMFNGFIYPFTNDPTKPISDISTKLPAGDYKMEMIGRDEEGKTYTVDITTIVDNKGPEVDMKMNGVIEVNDSMFTEEDGQNAVWVHGTVNDATVNLLQSKGMEYDQSSNQMGYYMNGSWMMNGFFDVAADGFVKFGIEKSDIEDQPLKLRLATWDMATAINNQYLVFMKEGTEYTSAIFDAKEVKLGDTLTMTVSLNNVKQFISGEFDVEFANEIFKFQKVQLNSAIKKYAKEQGLELTLDEAVVTEGQFFNTVKVGSTINGNVFSGLDGDMPIFDVKFKVVNDDQPYGKYDFKVLNGTYMKADETEATTISHYSTDVISLFSKQSTVQGYIGPEAFLHEDGFLYNKDYTKVGAKVYAQSRSGKKYHGTIDTLGRYTIPKIPASNQVYTIVIDVPGHLKTMQDFIPGFTVDGDIRGQRITFPLVKAVAGDITGDKMVDIRDIQAVVDAYGDKDTSILQEDINQDGVVDEQDVRLIEKNFLMKGPDAAVGAVPKEKIGNKGIEYFLRLIGLELNN